MAEEDIYGNKARYEKFVNGIESIIHKPRIAQGKYYCINRANLKYFKAFIHKLEVDDLSYVRRHTLLMALKIATFYITADLKHTSEMEAENLLLNIRKTHSPRMVRDRCKDIKRIAIMLFGDGAPKPLIKLKTRIDISMERARKDKLTYEEFDKIMNFFANDATIQAYLAVSFETLVRPQELLYTRLSCCEFNDKYTIIHINEHGKEGTKKLLCIDSNPYLLRAVQSHPNKSNNEAHLFLNNYNSQLTPFAVNKRLKLACKQLNISKPITCYSLKRFGVTYRRLKGDADVTIQKIAGWKSLAQLRTYDHSDQDDVFKRELAKRGLIEDEKYKELMPQSKDCAYCGERIGFADKICTKCKRLLDGSEIKKNFERDEADKKAEDEMKAVFKMALENPKMNFIEIMDRFRMSSS